MVTPQWVPCGTVIGLTLNSIFYLTRLSFLANPVHTHTDAHSVVAPSTATCRAIPLPSIPPSHIAGSARGRPGYTGQRRGNPPPLQLTLSPPPRPTSPLGPPLLLTRLRLYLLLRRSRVALRVHSRTPNGFAGIETVFLFVCFFLFNFVFFQSFVPLYVFFYCTVSPLPHFRAIMKRDEAKISLANRANRNGPARG